MLDFKTKTFYHGTNYYFDRFNPRMIGAHDRGWYGRGFYFCFTKGEASFYGRNILEVKLDVNKPFDFQAELQTMDGEDLDIFGDLAIFAIRLSEKFPDLAKQLSITAVKYFDDRGEAVEEQDLTFPEYAELVMAIYQDQNFEPFECYDRDKIAYFYRMGDDYNAVRFRFDTEEAAKRHRLSMAACYVHDRKFAHLDLHTPEYFMQEIADQFTNELIRRGYDGIIQSEDGDEVICFNPDQISIVSRIAEMEGN